MIKGEKMDNQHYAHIFCEAIKKLGNNAFALDNLESYLSQHFETWLKDYASNPPAIAAELKSFAHIANYTA